jgi:hypothetical protein
MSLTKNTLEKKGVLLLVGLLSLVEGQLSPGSGPDEDAVPRLETATIEQASIFWNKTLKELEKEFNFLATFIREATETDTAAVNAKHGLYRSLTSILNFIFQGDPFDFTNSECLKTPQLWLTLEKLVSELGENSKAQYEQSNAQLIEIYKAIFVDSNSLSQMFERLSMLQATKMQVAEENKDSCLCSKLTTVVGQDNIKSMNLLTQQIKAFESNPTSRCLIDLMFTNTFNQRKDLLEWIKLIQIAQYRHTHLPTKEHTVAMQRTKEHVEYSIKLSKAYESMLAGWTRIAKE